MIFKINNIFSYDVRGDDAFSVSLDCSFHEFKEALTLYEKDRSTLSFFLHQKGEEYKIFTYVSHHNLEEKKLR